MPINKATWQTEPGVPLAIRELPLPSDLSPNQLLIKSHAWAINPCDYIIQDIGLPFIKYPLVLGEDVAGEVVSVGSAASARFKPKDRVCGLATGQSEQNDTKSAFQDYVVLDAGFVSHIPNSISFAEASIFPLCVETSAHGLFNKKFLNMQYPKLDSKPKGKSVLIWGGASSVGSNAIQFASAAGYEVIATASAKNFALVKGLGAHKVFDYNSETVIPDIVADLDKTDCVGIFQAAGTPKPCIEVAEKAKGDLFVACARPLFDVTVPDGVKAEFISGVMMENEIGPGIFEDYLPNALAAGRYIIAPEPMIMGTKGLAGVQEGLDMLRKGISARKVVVVAE